MKRREHVSKPVAASKLAFWRACESDVDEFVRRGDAESVGHGGTQTNKMTDLH